MRNKGFTLLEMAVVLFIAGIVLTGALQIMSAINANTGVPETRNTLNKVDRAMLAYIASQDDDPDNKPEPAPVYFSGVITGQGACDCTRNDTATYPSEHMPGFEVTGCGYTDCRSRSRTLPYADIDNDGVSDTDENTGGVPWSTLGLDEDSKTDFWGQAIQYSADSGATSEGVHSGLSGNAYTLQTTHPDTGGTLKRERAYSELVGMLIQSGLKVD